MRSTTLLIMLSFILNTALVAEWNPDAIPQYGRFQHLLDDDAYVSLKNQVSDALADSWCSREKTDLLMDLTLLTHPKICVEVGVFTGSSLLPVAAALRHLDSGLVFAIDSWSNEEAVKNLANDDPNKAWWSQVDMADAYARFRKCLDEWCLNKFCVTICKPSEKACRCILADIDFLHLDGDYSEAGALLDVELYLPKVRTGGYILLSNFYLIVNREQPKMQAFCALCECCDIAAVIEKGNAVLFQKN